MSLETWKQEFYPISAVDAAELYKDNPAALVEHSLLKWIGLRPENILKHACKLSSYAIYDEKSGSWMGISSSSCVLCEKYYDEEVEYYDEESEIWDDEELDHSCKTCPLYKTLGFSCDYSGDTYEENGPYNHFPDVEPMISALEITLENTKQNKS